MLYDAGKRQEELLKPLKRLEELIHSDDLVYGMIAFRSKSQPTEAQVFVHLADGNFILESLGMTEAMRDLLKQVRNQQVCGRK